MAPPIKVALLILGAVAHRIAIKPPHPPANTKDKVTRGTLFEKIARRMAVLLQVITFAFFSTECAILLATYFENSQALGVLSNVCGARSLPSISTLSTFSPVFLTGLGMMYTSALLRLWCYKALGTLFTYEITIRPNHTLVTSGPYGYVRHPSYTGSVLMMVGTAMVGLSSGSYIDECHMLSTPARYIIILWLGILAYVVVSLLGRGKVEDANLRKEFGESWDRYYRDVPCKFIPGIV
ncbi:hypothetical protein K439DRAFT_1395756 [Ramaria rubella]|nr:hypothetical protein K439DRAFT_1395756 [Ramaria rubella]